MQELKQSALAEQQVLAGLAEGLGDPDATTAARGLLNAIWHDNTQMDEVAGFVHRDDFFLPGHRVIFDAMLSLHAGGKPVDVATVGEWLIDRKQLALVDAKEASRISLPTQHELLAVFNTVATNTRHYAELVRKYAILRRLDGVAREIKDLCDHPAGEPAELLDRAERMIYEVANQTAFSPALPIRQTMNEFALDVERRAEADETPGLPTGLWSLDAKIAGLRPGELIVLAARPSVGKTTLALWLARSQAIAGHPVLFFSLEMSRKELMERIIAGDARIDTSRLQHPGRLTPDEWAAFAASRDRTREWAFYVQDSRMVTATRLMSVSRSLKRRAGIRVVLVDYLQLLEPENARAPRHEQVGLAARRLKQLAGDLNVPVVCLAQLNRESEHRPDKKPRLSDLRDSGEIEQHADVVLLLHPPDEHSPQIEVNVAKNRNGPKGAVVLYYHRAQMRFEDAVPDFGRPL